MLSGQRVLRFVVAGALSACLLAAIPADAGEWLADTASGCQVWDPNPQLDESVTWSGGCTNGHADGLGTVKWLKHNAAIETDDGEWRDGRQVGKGVQNWPVGRYEGELADGLPNGRGVLTFDKYRYEGEFRDGKPDGIGTLSAGDQSVQGTWKGGCLQGQRKASIGIPLSDCH
jgi:hypothetical protein